MERKGFTSVMPKTAYYRTDGTGRDTYISFDNGGTFQPMMKLPSYEKAIIRPKTAVSKYSVRSLHYLSDGTGRDSYIRISDGGLHSPNGPKHFLSTFKNSLRDYQPINKTNDVFTWTQNCWQTNKHRFVAKNNGKKIQECVNRLYSTTKFKN